MDGDIYLRTQLAKRLETLWVAELRLELSIEGFLVSILSGTPGTRA
jgi:hypothetical protein